MIWVSYKCTIWSIFGPWLCLKFANTLSSRICRKLMQFTHFIRKVIPTKILLSGKFSFFSDSSPDSLWIWFVPQRNPESQLFPPQSDLGTQCAANNEDIYRKESPVLVSFLPRKGVSWNWNHTTSFLFFGTEYISLTRLLQHMYI